MAGHQIDPDWGGTKLPLYDELDADTAGEDLMDSRGTTGQWGEWDDRRESSAHLGPSGTWSVSYTGGGPARVRHARRRPSLLLRVSVVVVAGVVLATLVIASVYRLRGQQSAGSTPHGTVAHTPPVITLFSSGASGQNQGTGAVGSVTPLPSTSTAAPSQYLAPDQASDYELSLIAASGTPEKAIVVSRFSQTIHVYQNGQFIAGSYAITGRPELPTPVGVYQIFLKVAPAVLYSPWPPGSPFYYAPAPVNYTMEFRAGGFLIHDAPWHHVWGPGMNDWHYDPGANEWQWGTHGCVTAPTPFIQWLYNWSPDGTTVIIY